jgi:hypothetical protein
MTAKNGYNLKVLLILGGFFSFLGLLDICHIMYLFSIILGWNLKIAM